MTKFNISKIEIENFRSIQNKVALDIKPGLFSIEGQNLDEASHNGAGKSTLVSALYWCLTGNALTNEVLADEVVNIKAGKDCRVTTYIESDKGDIKITRTRKDTELGNNLIVEMGGQDISCHKIADTQERLNQLLKIPFNLLHSTIIMTSDIKSAFSDLTPQQRIQTLESIRDYTVWDKVRDEANKNIKEYGQQIDSLNNHKSNLEGQITTYNSLYERVINNLRENYNIIVDINKLDEAYSKLNAQIAENKEIIEKNKVEIEKLTKEKTELAENFAKEQQNDPQKVSQVPGITQIITKETLDEIVNQANDLKSQVQSLYFERQTIEKDLEVVQKWFKDDTCPTCNQKLIRTDQDIYSKNAQKLQFEAKIKEIDNKLDEINKKLNEKRNEWSTKNKIFKDNEIIQREFEARRYLDLQNKVKEQKIKEKHIQDKIDALQLQVTSLEKLNYQNENAIKSFSEIKDYQKNVEDLKTQITEDNKNIQTYDNKRQLSTYFYKLLGSKGELRPYLLNKDIQYLNDSMQKYIVRFFKNTTVKLVLNGSTIEILIDSAGIKKSISSLSGGEKKRLNLAIQLALYDLLKSTSQISFNILWLDEVESQLDSLGCQQLIDIIEDKSEEISSVFWITNNSMVKENIPKKIICTKKMGKTEITQ